MTFRARLLTAFLFAVLLPMVCLALFVRSEMTERLSTQYEQRVDALMEVIENDLARESKAIDASIEQILTAIRDDNRFRSAAVEGDEDDREHLLDVAGQMMRLAGLTMLQIQDEDGRIISSGHFRNEYDRLEPNVPRLLAEANDLVLMRARAPDAPFLALVRMRSIQLAGETFSVVGGAVVDQHFLSRFVRDNDLIVALKYPGGEITSSEKTEDKEETSAQISRERGLSYLEPSGKITPAVFRVEHRLTELQALRSSIDRWFIVAVAATAVLAILMVTWLALRMSRPLAALAEKTSRVDLDRLDVEFDTRRADEIGALSRVLDAMTRRLRVSAIAIRDAERRATLGELARQVNHDIKNGLTPIRNVFRHLSRLARDDATELPAVFVERQATIDASMSYLEDLASNYAGLTPIRPRELFDVKPIVAGIVGDLQQGTKANVTLTTTPGTAMVVGDPVSLRRIVENLTNNAIDSLAGDQGSVAVSISAGTDEDERAVVRVVVADTGAGMDETEQEKIFDDFYTTKTKGTGLGLSIVRRLVMDLGGTITVESEFGQGTKITVDLPSAGAPMIENQKTRQS